MDNKLKLMPSRLPFTTNAKDKEALTNLNMYLLYISLCCEITIELLITTAAPLLLQDTCRPVGRNQLVRTETDVCVSAFDTNKK